MQNCLVWGWHTCYKLCLYAPIDALLSNLIRASVCVASIKWCTVNTISNLCMWIILCLSVIICLGMKNKHPVLHFQHMVRSMPWVFYAIFEMHHLNKMYMHMKDWYMFGCVHFHHMWISCEAPPRLLSPRVCHRLQAVNISVQWSCIWRQPAVGSG